MFGVALYSLIKNYFEQEGIKNNQSEQGLTYSEMYDKEYIEHLKNLCESLFIDHNLDNECVNEDELCEVVWDAQYKIDVKIREELNKLN